MLSDMASWKHDLKEKLVSHRRNLLDIVLILVIGSLSITWFRNNLLFNSSDFGLPINRQYYLEISKTTWVKTSTGIMNSVSPSSLLFAVFSYFTELINIPLVTYEMIIFYIWFTMSGISMYMLLNIVGAHRISKISGSLIYMMNPFSLIIIWAIGQGMVQKPYAFFPLIIGLYVWGIKKQKKFKYAILTALIWLTTGFFGPDANPQFAIIYWIAIAVFFLIYVIAYVARGKTQYVKNLICFTVVFFLAWVILNLFWIGPITIYMQEHLGVFVSYQAKIYAPNLEIFRQNSAQILDSIRLLGYWAFKPNFGDLGGAYYEFAVAYSTQFFVLLSFLLPILSILSFFKKGIKLENLIFGIILITGIFFVKGSFEPFGELNEFLFMNIPLAQAFRNPYAPGMMLLALSVSVLAATGIGVIYENLGKLKALKYYRLKRLTKPLQAFSILFLLFLLVGILVFPFWTGDFSRPLQKYPFTSTRIQIPDYYYQFSKWDLAQNGDYRLMDMPLAYGYNYIYRWNYGYVGPSILPYFTTKDVVFAQTLRPLYDVIVDAQGGKALPDTSFSKLVGLMSVKYIVLHNDTDWEVIEQPYLNPYKGANSLTVNETITHSGFIKKEKIGELTIYESKFVTPRVFATNKYISIDNIQSLPYFISLTDSPLAIITDNQSESRQFINDTIKLDPIGFYFDANNNGTTTFFVKNEGLYQLISGNYADIRSIDDNPSNLSDILKLKADNLLDLSGGISIQGVADSFEIHNNTVYWKIDQKYDGTRYIDLPFKQPSDFTDASLAVYIYGNNSSNTLTFQVYSKNGHWINWRVKDDWKGFRWLTFSLNKFDGSSTALSGTNESPLDVKSIFQLSIYYDNANLKSEGGVSSVQISSIVKLSSAQKWLTTPDPIFLSKGYHTIKFGVPQDSFGVYLKRLVPEVDNQVQISYQRTSSSEVHVSIRNASKPFVLVFSDSYNEGWSAYYGNLIYPMIWSPEDKLIDDHFQVNGYANAWYIDKTGTFEITLYFKPERTLSLSLVISAVAILASTTYLIFPRPKSRLSKAALRRFFHV